VTISIGEHTILFAAETDGIRVRIGCAADLPDEELISDMTRQALLADQLRATAAMIDPRSNGGTLIVLRGGPASGQTRWHATHPDLYTEPTAGAAGPAHSWRWYDHSAMTQTDQGPAPVYDYIIW
jgi:hypothetical protein